MGGGLVGDNQTSKGELNSLRLELLASSTPFPKRFKFEFQKTDIPPDSDLLVAGAKIMRWK